MPLPRVRLRTLMIAVAVTGIMLGARQELRRRGARYRAIADRHQADLIEYCGDLVMKPEGWYHIAMMEKYRRLARYPWLTVPPDPPAPE